jgi:hypothetical protein
MDIAVGGIGVLINGVLVFHDFIIIRFGGDGYKEKQEFPVVSLFSIAAIHSIMMAMKKAWLGLGLLLAGLPLASCGPKTGAEAYQISDSAVTLSVLSGDAPRVVATYHFTLRNPGNRPLKGVDFDLVFSDGDTAKETESLSYRVESISKDGVESVASSLPCDLAYSCAVKGSYSYSGTLGTPKAVLKNFTPALTYTWWDSFGDMVLKLLLPVVLVGGGTLVFVLIDKKKDAKKSAK